jgi:hypothetical protein
MKRRAMIIEHSEQQVLAIAASGETPPIMVGPLTQKAFS